MRSLLKQRRELAFGDFALDALQTFDGVRAGQGAGQETVVQFFSDFKKPIPWC
jgi:hypothetical protein